MKYYTRPDFVPLVVKNRDFLIGYLDALFGFELGDAKTDAILKHSSVKFTDILPDGQRRRNMLVEDIITAMIDYRMKMNVVEDPESYSELTEEDEYFLELNCQCGNYVAFKTEADVPHHTHKCDLCGKILIDYTHSDDKDFAYDGDEEKQFDFLDVVEMLMDGAEDEDDDESSGEEV